MLTSFGRRVAIGFGIAACAAVATTCGAPTHDFYDDKPSGTGGASGATTVTGTAGKAGATSTGSAGSGGSIDGGSGAGGGTGRDAAAGSAGAAGSGGTGGAGSTGGAGGSAGAGGSKAGGAGTAGAGGKVDGGMGGSAAGSGGGKVDAGSENCFDNIDNNADGMIDCADPTCATVATCVPDTTGFALGVLVDATAACPPGTTAAPAGTINRGITADTACTGCSCTPNAVTCTANVYLYKTAAECTADTTNAGGMAGGPLNAPCVDNKIYYDGNTGGIRVAISAGQSCTNGGAAALPGARWTTSKKLCTYAQKGGGCATGKKCVPVQTDTNTQCALAAGAAACTGFGTTQNDWYTGYSDGRSCAACGCIASGGSCANSYVQVGSDYLCSVQSTLKLMNGAKTCTTPYSPPMGLSASSTPSQCTASSAVGGAITPTGQQTLCCAPR